jgi:hypothetical protein
MRESQVVAHVATAEWRVERPHGSSRRDIGAITPEDLSVSRP